MSIILFKIIKIIYIFIINTIQKGSKNSIKKHTILGLFEIELKT
jgi:hypothetical protein